MQNVTEDKQTGSQQTEGRQKVPKVNVISTVGKSIGGGGD